MILRGVTVCIFLLLSYSSFSQKVLDTTYLTCQYKLLSSRDTTKAKMEDDLLILQVGKKVSKCYSYYTEQVDSIMRLPDWFAIMKKYLNKAFAQETTGYYPHKRMRTHVYKNFPEGEMTVTDGISLQDFIYKEELKPQEWSIEDDTTRILGYSCQKAECDFRGRHYVAWFTPEIPVSDGPWKFFGLPGLIMEVYDRGKQYHFTITGIEKSNAPIVFSKSTLQNGKYAKTERKKFLKAEKRYLMDKGGYIQAETGIKLGNDQKVMRYDLLERDYNQK